MKKIYNLLVLIIAVLASTNAIAQDAEMADGMRSSGKIYVVVGIIVIVLIGLIVYLFMMDQKLTKMEKQLNRGDKPKSI